MECKESSLLIKIIFKEVTVFKVQDPDPNPPTPTSGDFPTDSGCGRI